MENKKPLSIVVCAIINKNKICLIKRNKAPYKDYWAMIGGKLELSESIEQSALREAKEETNLDCQFEKLSSVIHERLKENNETKNTFIIFLTKLKTKQTQFKSSKEGNLEWFDLDNLPEKLILSDKIMIEEMLDCDFCLREVIIEESFGELVDIVVK